MAIVLMNKHCSDCPHKNKLTRSVTIPTGNTNWIQYIAKERRDRGKDVLGCLRGMGREFGVPGGRSGKRGLKFIKSRYIAYTYAIVKELIKLYFIQKSFIGL